MALDVSEERVDIGVPREDYKKLPKPNHLCLMKGKCLVCLNKVEPEGAPLVDPDEVCICDRDVLPENIHTSQGHCLYIFHHAFLHHLDDTLEHSTVIDMPAHTILVKCHYDVNLALWTISEFLLLAVFADIISYQTWRPLLIHPIL
jgi:hypothetical protein